MNIFKNLKLRTKLIGSFLLFAFIAVIFTFIGPQTALERFSNDVPTVAVVGRMGTVVNKIQAKVLEFIANNNENSITDLNEAISELNVLVEQLQNNQSNALGDRMVELSQRLTILSQEIVRSHRRTVQELETLQSLEDKANEIFADIQPLIAAEYIRHLQEEDVAVHVQADHPTQQYFDEITEATLLLQFEAMEFVTVEEEEAKDEVDEIETQLDAGQEGLRQLWETNETGDMASIENLERTTAPIVISTRNVLDSHTETLASLKQLEGIEKEIDQTIADAQASAVEDARLEVSMSQRNLTIFLGIALVLALLLGGLTTRSIVRPLYQLVETARQLGTGDLSVRAEGHSQDEIGQLAQVFNQMADRLREAFARAEQQSQQRIRQLEVMAEISRQLISILDVDDLLRQMVSSIQNAFGYYHVHIYLIDQNTGELVMREGTGPIGQQLRAQGHRLKPGQGIVGRVADSGESFLAENVDEVPDFVRNPLLPQTQAELAVPIHKGNVILGVLDVQSEEVGGFNQEDLTLMQSVADQVAVALDNARLFRQARAAAAEAEELNRRFTREAWSDISHKISSNGYVFTKSDVAPIPTSSIQTTAGDEGWLPIMAEAIQQKDLVYRASEGNDSDTHQPTSCVSIPLILRNEVIGVIGIERASSSGVEIGSGVRERENQKSSILWTEDELTTIRAVAEQVALALDTARLARETQRAAWRDRVVSESTAKVWATSEIEEVMKTAVAQLGDRLRASEVVIRLGKGDELLQE